MKTTTYTQETDLARKSVMARQIAAALRYRMNNGQFNNKTLRLAASAAVNFMHESDEHAIAFIGGREEETVFLENN